VTPATRPSARVTVADLGDLPPVLSIEEAAELLRLGRSAAYAAAARGERPTLRVGRRRLVPTARLLELLGLRVAGDGSEPGDYPAPVESLASDGGGSSGS
jgi:excisionase family DNA binding protein